LLLEKADSMNLPVDESESISGDGDDFGNRCGIGVAVWINLGTNGKGGNALKQSGAALAAPAFRIAPSYRATLFVASAQTAAEPSLMANG
jgi:hypothetical protein